MLPLFSTLRRNFHLQKSFHKPIFGILNRLNKKRVTKSKHRLLMTTFEKFPDFFLNQWTIPAILKSGNFSKLKQTEKCSKFIFSTLLFLWGRQKSVPFFISCVIFRKFKKALPFLRKKGTLFQCLSPNSDVLIMLPFLSISSLFAEN